MRQQLFHDRLRHELDCVEGVDVDAAAAFAEVGRGTLRWGRGLGWAGLGWTRRGLHYSAEGLRGGRQREQHGTPRAYVAALLCPCHHKTCD